MGNPSVVLPREVEALPVAVLKSTGITASELAVANSTALLDLQRQLLMGSSWGKWEVDPKLISVRRATPGECTYVIDRAVPDGLDLMDPWRDRVWKELLRIAIAYRLWPGQQGVRLAYSTIQLRLRSVGRLTKILEPHSDEAFWSKLFVEELKTHFGKSVVSDLRCLSFLHARGVLADVPTTYSVLAKSGVRRSRINEAEHEGDVESAETYQPFPDDFVGTGSSRVIWLLENVGPSILSYHEAVSELPVRLINEDPRSPGYGEELGASQLKALATSARNDLLEKWDWVDSGGQQLSAIPFQCSLTTSPFGPFDWPPRRYSEALSILGTLQTCHLWVLAFAMGNRHGELLSLEEGFLGRLETSIPTGTFSSSKMDIVGGRAKEVPVPALVLKAAAQQERLCRLIKRVNAVEGSHLWVSTWRNSGQPLTSVNRHLKNLVSSLGLMALLDGTSAHMHRFRKSLVRACALALVHAPKVLMDILGHRDEQITVMRYILSDVGLLADIEETVRELVVLKGVEAVKRSSELGGGAAPRVRERVNEYARRQGTKALEPQNMMEFVRALTEDGGGWAIIAPGIVCTGFTRGGLCNKGQGSADPDYCHPKCDKQLVMPERDENGTTISNAVIDAMNTVDYMLTQVLEAEQAGESMIVAQFVGQIKAMMGRWREVDDHFQNNPLVRKHIPLVLSEQPSA